MSMNPQLTEEREKLLNRLVEIQAELTRVEIGNMRTEPEFEQVWREISTGNKVVIRGPKTLALIKNNTLLFQYICDRPHGDGDFSYICGQDHCRCTQ